MLRPSKIPTAPKEPKQWGRACSFCYKPGSIFLLWCCFWELEENQVGPLHNWGQKLTHHWCEIIISTGRWLENWYLEWFCFVLKPICSISKETCSFAVVQSLSGAWLFATLWPIVRQASLSSTISQSLLKLTFIELVMPSNHLILCCPLLLLPSIFPSIRVFSNESALHIRWPKH